MSDWVSRQLDQRSEPLTEAQKKALKGQAIHETWSPFDLIAGGIPAAARAVSSRLSRAVAAAAPENRWLAGQLAGHAALQGGNLGFWDWYLNLGFLPPSWNDKYSIRRSFSAPVDELTQFIDYYRSRQQPYLADALQEVQANRRARLRSTQWPDHY